MIEQIIDGRTDLVLAHGEHRIHSLHEERLLNPHYALESLLQLEIPLK